MVLESGCKCISKIWLGNVGLINLRFDVKV